jgi:hypothetical protein
VDELVGVAGQLVEVLLDEGVCGVHHRPCEVLDAELVVL